MFDTTLYQYLFTFLGFFIIYIATDVGRKPSSNVSFFSWKGLLQFCLILVGVILIAHYN